MLLVYDICAINICIFDMCTDAESFLLSRKTDDLDLGLGFSFLTQKTEHETNEKETKITIDPFKRLIP